MKIIQIKTRKHISLKALCSKKAFPNAKALVNPRVKFLLLRPFYKGPSIKALKVVQVRLLIQRPSLIQPFIL